MARFRIRHVFALLAAVAVTSFIISEADARVGRGGSLGSRGARTYSAPPPTATAPSTAAPMQRTITQPNATRPTTPATSPSPGLAGRPGGMFGGGLLGGLAAGFIGAGLFGLLFGHGFLGGLMASGPAASLRPSLKPHTMTRGLSGRKRWRRSRSRSSI